MENNDGQNVRLVDSEKLRDLVRFIITTFSDVQEAIVTTEIVLRLIKEESGLDCEVTRLKPEIGLNDIKFEYD